MPKYEPAVIWRSRVLTALRGPSIEDVEAIVKRCVDAEAAGEICNVWHQSALHYGHKCNCRACNPAS